MELIDVLKENIGILKNFDGYIKVVSHYDADGISSAAILYSALRRNGNDFSIRIVKRIDDDLIEDINTENPDLVIFSDIGSSYDLRKLKPRAILLDHHESKKLFGSKVIEINPMNFSIEELSGSGVTYLFMKELNRYNIFLSYLGIAGAIGDIRPIVGMNFEILSDAQKAGVMTVSKSLNVFGSTTRPLHKSIYMNQILPNINSESSSIQFLSQAGIKVKDENGWRTLSDLSDDEMRKLTSAIIAERIGNGFRNHSDIFSVRMLINGINMDVNEFSTILNAFGRLGKYYDGIKFAVNPTRDVAMKVYKEYKKSIGKYMRWSAENVELKKFTLIDADDKINPNFIGTICSMIIKSNDNVDTIVGLANDEGGTIKVSARSKKIDMNSVVTKIIDKIGGEAGGHYNAAGATIEIGKKKQFLDELKRILNVSF